MNFSGRPPHISSPAHIVLRRYGFSAPPVFVVRLSLATITVSGQIQSSQRQEQEACGVEQKCHSLFVPGRNGNRATFAVVLCCVEIERLAAPPFRRTAVQRKASIECAAITASRTRCAR